MSSFTLNQKIKNQKLIFLSLLAFFIIFTGCSQNTTGKIPNTDKNSKDTEFSEKSLFNVDVNIKKELVIFDEKTNTILAYLRIKHNIMPLKSEQNVLAGKLTFSEEEPLSDFVYRVRLAGALKPETISVDDVKRLKFGSFTLNPSRKMVTGFNEIDIYGSGACDIIFELAIKPEENIESIKSAEEYLKDLCYDGRIGFSYAVIMDRSENKQLYRKVEIKVPEKVFNSKNEIYLFSFQL